MEHLRLLVAQVGHERVAPWKHPFAYPVLYVAAPVFPESLVKQRFFSLNKHNLLSIFWRDYAERDGTHPLAWLRARYKEHGIEMQPTDRVTLVTHPRICGFAFNPISFWLLQDTHGSLRAVICEVHNTFGDDHAYVIAHSCHAPILPTDVFHAHKHLFVSPFNTMQGRYTFSFALPEEKFKTQIFYYQNDTLTLKTFMEGRFVPYAPWRAVWVYMRYPLMTLLVVARIHAQALRIYLKGLRTQFGHYAPTTQRTTTSTDS